MTGAHEAILGRIKEDRKSLVDCLAMGVPMPSPPGDMMYLGRAPATSVWRIADEFRVRRARGRLFHPGLVYSCEQATLRCAYDIETAAHRAHPCSCRAGQSVPLAGTAPNAGRSNLSP
jgi:hypothetical protein